MYLTEGIRELQIVFNREKLQVHLPSSFYINIYVTHSSRHSGSGAYSKNFESKRPPPPPHPSKWYVPDVGQGRA